MEMENIYVIKVHRIHMAMEDIVAYTTEEPTFNNLIKILANEIDINDDRDVNVEIRAKSLSVDHEEPDKCMDIYWVEVPHVDDLGGK